MTDYFLKAKLVLASLFLCLIVTACGSSSSSGIGDYHKIQGQIFGTTYHITYKDPSTGVNKEIISADVQKRLDQLDWIFSTYKPESELSKFNKAAPSQAPIVLSPELYEVLALSQKVYQDSGKAFDPSIGPLVNIWGFGPKLTLEHFNHQPKPEAMATAKQQLNFDALELGKLVDANKSEYFAIKSKPMTLDLSAVAKGYAVDQIMTLLKQSFIDNAMVEIGGELRTQGVNAKDKTWKIGVEKPEDLNAQGSKVSSVLYLNQASVATSGDYRNYREVGGQRLSHTIDPRTGMPVNHKLTSVTVVADSVALADAWATALMVLGEDEGLKLAQQAGIHALLIYRDGDGYNSVLVGKMSEYLSPKAPSI